MAWDNVNNLSVWTDERIELLKKRWAEGLSCSLIAKELGAGITRNAVVGKVHRLGCAARQVGGVRERIANGLAVENALPAKPRKPRPSRARPNRVRPERVRAAKPPKPPRAPKPPKERKPRLNNLAGINAERRARKDRTPRPARPEPVLVEVTMAKPWLERAFGECAYIVSGSGADAIACCNPCDPRGYCPGHRAIMYIAPPTAAEKRERREAFVSRRATA